VVASVRDLVGKEDRGCVICVGGVSVVTDSYCAPQRDHGIPRRDQRFILSGAVPADTDTVASLALMKESGELLAATELLAPV
jgi:hypothetical protein